MMTNIILAGSLKLMRMFHLNCTEKLLGLPGGWRKSHTVILINQFNAFVLFGPVALQD